MGLTTERKIFLGLVGVAGLALIIDQGILGPSEATADVFPQTAAEASSELAGAEPVDSSRPAAMILIDRLESISASDQDTSFGSSFLLAKIVQPSIEIPITSDQGSGIENLNTTNSFPVTQTTVSDLPILSAAMPAKNGGGAVLGGKLLRVGEVDPSGFRLVLVHARAVLVERDGVQYAIEIPTSRSDD